jgi:hypothetical protein
MITSRYARQYSTEEIVAVAERIYLLMERGRIVRLRPETAWLVERAVRAYAARPGRDQLMALLCGNPHCKRRSDCMICMGKANAVMRLYEGPD